MQWKWWWVSMQPEWRNNGDVWPPTREHSGYEEWAILASGGSNGLFLVILSLSWWAKADLTDNTREVLLSAIEDVQWVIDQIAAGLSSTCLGKRWSMIDEELSP
jgi:hypothetical protein